MKPLLARSACLLALVPVALLAGGACGGDGAADARQAEHWLPSPTTAPWQWQLQGRIDTSVDAAVYETDGFDTPAGVVEELHAQKRRVICYIDVGSWENFRPDRRSFPKSVLGKRYQGFPDERWLDIRRIGAIAAPLRKRFQMCKSKGFDAVEPDNVNGYTNDTGFPLTAHDQLRFNRWVARQVHVRGMAVALKNDPEQARRLVGSFDFAVVEQCFQYHECDRFLRFVNAGKAVFDAEYELAPARFCARAQALAISAIRKTYALTAFRRVCP
jgi:hypothetical protein